MNDKPIAVVASEKNDFYRIDIKREDFREFLKSVLGKRRTIRKTIKGNFVVGFQDLLNVHHMIAQRVERQNVSVVSTFRCIIDFDDNFRRILEDTAPFENMVETKTETVSRVSLEYSFLIQFPDKSFPEKQEIVVRFDTSPDKTIRYHRSTSPIYFEEADDAGIFVEVHYTELTWGDDVEHMLSPYLQSNYLIENRSKEINRFLSFFHKTVITALVLDILYFLYSLFVFRDEAALRQRATLLAKSIVVSLDRKIDALMIDAVSVSPDWTDYVTLGFKSLPFLCFIAILYCMDNTARGSLIILNGKGRDRLIAESRRINTVYIAGILAFVVSILAGLATNYLQNS